MKPKNIFYFLILIFLVINIFLHNIKDVGWELLGLIKPITLVGYFGFLTFAFTLSYLKKPLQKIEREYLIIIGFLFLMATFFEVMWSFNYWFSLVEEGKDIDIIEYQPKRNLLTEEAINLNQSTKINVLWFFMSVYFLYFVHFNLKNNQ